MGERDNVGWEIKKQLIKENFFSEDLIQVEPNLDEILNKTIRDILAKSSEKEKKGTPDIFYCNEKAKFLFLLEAKKR